MLEARIEGPGAAAVRAAMASEVRQGLERKPRRVPSKYLYDRRGCELFDEITRLPEYYLSRAETEILAAHADEIAEHTRPRAIVELGAGYATKTRLLIAAAIRTGSLEHFVPTDVSPAAVDDVSRALPLEFNGLRVHGVVVEFEQVMDLPRFGRQLVIFLGSTVGNLDTDARVGFFRRIAGMLAAEDFFLLGVDLVKDPREIDAAYNDGHGVTAEFSRNLLAVLNRELGADFDLAGFEHVAAYHAQRRRVEIHLRSLRAQRVRLPECDLSVDFSSGELIHTEISVKFEREALETELSACGLHLVSWFTDVRGRFALALSRRGRAPRA